MDIIRRKGGTFLLASFFVILFLGPFTYKVLFLKYPILSKFIENLWTIEVKIQFRGSGGKGMVRHHIPGDDLGQMVLGEEFLSRDLDFFIGKGAGNTFVQWSGDRLKGDVHAFYRATVQTWPRTRGLLSSAEQEKDQLRVSQYLVTKPEMESMIVEAREFLEGLPGKREPDLEKIKAIYEFLAYDVETVLLSKESSLIAPLKTRKATITEKKNLLIYLSRVAGFPARVVHGLTFVEVMRQAKIRSWAEILIEGRWLPVDVESRFFAQLPEHVLILYRGDRPFMTSSGTEGLEYSFTIKQERQWAFSLFYASATKVGSVFHEWSLFALPVEAQQVFRVILMIPLGAVVVAIFRNVIGIKTFGTFMPVLIALAFRNTRLVWGLVLFSGVIALGLLSRWSMDRLRLLLVPRLSVIVTVLVIILALGSLIGHHAGTYRVLAVALFPMVIMTMTIERLSIILMERGAWAAIKVSLGTLLVATSCYLVMSIRSLQDFFFAFPEVLFALIGIQIALGRYTGYRVMEYLRFHSFIEDDTLGQDLSVGGRRDTDVV